jgi:hypothetical protein
MVDSSATNKINGERGPQNFLIALATESNSHRTRTEFRSLLRSHLVETTIKTRVEL